MDQLKLIRVNNPFDRTDRRVEVLDYCGQGLDELCVGYFGQRDVTIAINGKVVPKTGYRTRRIEAGDEILLIPDIGEGKDVLRAVLLIAIVIAAPYLAGLAAPAFGITTAIGEAILAGMIVVGGGILVNALLPPSQPRIEGLADRSEEAYGLSYAWRPTTLQREGLVIPRVYGKNKLYGNIIHSYVYSQYHLSTIGLLVALGHGKLANINNIELNDQPWYHFKDLSIYTRLGLLNQTAVEGFKQVTTTEVVNQTVTYGNPKTHTTTSSDMDGLYVTVSFPAGIWHVTDEGAIISHGIWIRVEYKRSDSGTWLPYADELHLADQKIKNGYFTNGSGDPWIPTDWTNYNSDAGELAKSTSPFPIGYALKIDNDAADEGLYQGSLALVNGKKYRLSPWLKRVSGSLTVKISHPTHGTVFSETLSSGYAEWGQYVKDFTLSLSSAEDYELYLYSSGGGCEWLAAGVYLNPFLDGYIPCNEATLKPIYKTIWIGGLDNGYTYDVRVTKYSQDATPAERYGDTVVFNQVIPTKHDDLSYPGIALLGIHAAANDQLSGTLRVSCTTDGQEVRVWNGSSWSWSASSNPAWVAWDILSQPVRNPTTGDVYRYDGINPSRLDLDKFYELAQYCDGLVPDGNAGTEKRCQFNGVFDTEMSMWEAVLHVLRIGRAVPVWNGTELTLAIDKPADPVQLFSVGNISEAKFKETWLPLEERVSEVELDFVNSENNYARNKYSVMNTSAGTAGRKTRVSLFGVNKPSEAWRFGTYLLAQNQYIRRMVQFEVDLEAIACTIGDVIRVQHDLIKWGDGGRVYSATSTTVTLDKEVPHDEVETWKVMVRLTDDTAVEKTVTDVSNANGRSTCTISGTFATVPQKYDVFAYGKVDEYVRSMRVVNMEVTDTLRCRLKVADYASQIYSAADGTPVIPPYDPELPEGVPMVESLELNEIQEADLSTGHVVRTIEVGWDRPDSGYYDSAKVYCRIKGTTLWMLIEQTNKEASFIRDVLPGLTYEVVVQSVGVMGRVSTFDYSPSAEITISGSADNVAAPGDITGLQVKGGGTEFAGRNCEIEWDIPQETFGNDKLTNAGFEDGGGGDPWIPNGWKNHNSDSGELVDEVSDYKFGMHALKIVPNAADEGIKQDTVSLVNGKIYKLSAELKRVSGALTVKVSHPTHGTVFTETLSSGYASYTKYEKEFTLADPSEDDYELYLMSSGGACEWKVDGLELKQIKGMSRIRDYKVIVRKTDDTLLRTEYVTEPFYVYTYEMNLDDLSGSPIRQIKFQVWARDVLDTLSDNAATMTASNPAPSMAGETPTVNTVSREGISVDWSGITPSDHDVDKYHVYCDDENPPQEVLAECSGHQTMTFIKDLDVDTAYYIQVVPGDPYGMGTGSSVVEKSIPRHGVIMPIEPDDPTPPGEIRVVEGLVEFDDCDDKTKWTSEIGGIVLADDLVVFKEGSGSLKVGIDKYTCVEENLWYEGPPMPELCQVGGADRYITQGFKVDANCDLKRVGVPIQIASGTPPGAKVMIFNDNGSGKPQAKLGQVAIDGITNQRCYRWADFSTPISLTASTQYHFVLCRIDEGVGDYYHVLKGEDNYGDAQYDYYQYGDSLAALTASTDDDLLFRLFKDQATVNNHFKITSLGTKDISAYPSIEYWIKSNKTGSTWLQASMGESALGEETNNPIIAATWSPIVWGISGIAAGDRDAIAHFGFKVLDADPLANPSVLEHGKVWVWVDYIRAIVDKKIRARFNQAVNVWPQVVDRGDPSAVDWAVGSLTTDGAWHDLDCSSIVPEGARFIIFSANVRDNVVGEEFSMRQKGNSNAYNIERTVLQVSNVAICRTFVVACDTSRVVQYWATNVTWDMINITVRGWIF